MATRKLYLGVFLISLATLALEISLIRLFSISLWYHFAFMVISIAMFGFAFAGTWLAILKPKQPLFKSALLFSLTTLIGFFLVNNIPFDPYTAAIDPSHLFRLMFYYLFLGLPFFFSGLILAFVFSKYQESSGKVYFFNLTGAGIGSLLALPIISLFGVKLVFVIATIGLLASLCFTKNVKKVVLLIIAVLLLSLFPFEIKMSEYKELNLALQYPNSEHLQTRQNSFSRVDVVNSSFTRYAPGLSSQYRDSLPAQIGVLTDGSAMNAITAYTDSFADYLPTSIGYHLIENPKVLVINSGAGQDVMVALQKNASVVALETNPIIIKLIKEDYKELSGDIYNKAEVNVGYGRSFIKKEDKYDIIIISLAGNVLSSSAGMYGLTDNYLLTTESFQDYYNHLSEDGMLIVTRFLLYPPRESLRLFSLALAIDDAEKKVAMFRSWTTVTLILNKQELSNESIIEILEFTDKNRFDIIYLPGNFTPNQYARFEEAYYYNGVNQILENREEFYDNYVFDVRAVTDDKPFYFNFFEWRKLPQLYRLVGGSWQPFLDSGFVMLFLFFQALVISFVFILLPLLFFRKTKVRKLPLVYFFSIGLAYLFVEVVLIQKMILLLGHVVYSTSLVIFTMLTFSGIGSLFSQKMSKLRNVFILIIPLIALYALIMPTFIDALIQYGLIIKIIMSAIFIAPLAFFMGMPFPVGLRKIDKKLIPWAFGFNGIASVLSSIIAILLALSVGYSKVLLLAAFMYLISMFFMEFAVLFQS